MIFNKIFYTALRRQTLSPPKFVSGSSAALVGPEALRAILAKGLLLSEKKPNPNLYDNRLKINIK